MPTDMPPPKRPSGQHIVEERLVGADAAFSDDQYQDAYPPGIEGSFWHVARNFTILKWLKNFGMDKQRLLEVGCGRGILVDYLLGKRIDCIGCDLAALASRRTLPARCSQRPTSEAFRLLPGARSRVCCCVTSSSISPIRSSSSGHYRSFWRDSPGYSLPCRREASFGRSGMTILAMRDATTWQYCGVSSTLPASTSSPRGTFSTRSMCRHTPRDGTAAER
jgi:hypothetical protein